jgi:hypothetical protein
VRVGDYSALPHTPRATDRRNHLSTNTPDQEGVTTAYPLVYHAALARRIRRAFACQA